MKTKISVLIIENSAVNRKSMSDLINSSPNLRVIATAFNSESALNKLKKNDPDVILMSLEENNITDISLLEKKKTFARKIPVIIVSSNQNLINIAIEKGADEFIINYKNKEKQINIKEKIHNYLFTYGSKYIQNKIIDNINIKNVEINSFNIKNEKYERKTYKTYNKEFFENFEKNTIMINEKDLKRLQKRKFNIIAIGVSTGGPPALKSILPEIPENFPIPIIIIQHMPKGFTLEFAKSLNNICKLNVKEATNNEILKKGHIYIGSGGHHTKIKKINSNYQIEIFDDIHINGHKPSIGVLFKSVSEVAKDKAIAIIMTGMGHDGAREIGYIKKSGGLTIAQDEQSSVVFGMPKIAIEENNIDYIVPLNHMIKLLKAIFIDEISF